jgi:hypothetical protein
MFYTKIGSPEELSTLDFSDANNLLQKVALLTYARRAKRLLNRSTRPAVSTNFCLPVKNG